ncbi:Pick C1-like protein 1 [Seminavis robusta]|uniref:Pick C1-like protein 1 n=1 Tax=Seminavis robusta TaxID=568900 RepID=A0A9N8H8X8_9STRA|nr:Pick C1-like protein 1 [Seminavis robusta]|eukprot:Sro255_g100460.1 Pick C1-like protein 1 (1119) ;mRNA; r:61553-65585
MSQHVANLMQQKPAETARPPNITEEVDVDASDLSFQMAEAKFNKEMNEKGVFDEDDDDDDDHANGKSGANTQSNNTINTGGGPPKKRRTTIKFNPEVTKQGAGGVREPIFPPWTAFTDFVFHSLAKIVTRVAVAAARRPVPVILFVTVLSITLAAVGFFTNFELILDLERVFAPTNSRPGQHYEWIQSPEGFPDQTRKVILLYHNDGGTILTTGAMDRVFEGVTTIRTTPGYPELCQRGVYVDFNGNVDCRIMSATGYWTNHSTQVYRNESLDDAGLRERLSGYEFASGAPVYHDAILGNWERGEGGILTSAQSYLVTIDIPDIDTDGVTNQFEKDMLERLQDLREKYIAEDQASGVSVSTMDVMTLYAYELEYQRAIFGDLYLVAVVAMFMCGFVMITFARFGFGDDGGQKSRALLGLSSVYTIGCSMLTGNGLMFLIGVPFTTVTQILPYVVIGIGLDDTFIITGAYFRTDPSLDIIDRITITMEEVAHSILLTTITTTFAFLLGLLSSLPGVVWLCMYAFTTIAIDFVYQITVFTAFIVLDERRIQAGRWDCLCCFKTPPKEEKELEVTNVADEVIPEDAEYNPIEGREADNGDAGRRSSRRHSGKNDQISVQMNKVEARRLSLIGDHTTQEPASLGLPERIMAKYATYLLTPIGKGLVLLVFGAFTGICAWRATLLTQDFKLGDFVPSDSYLRDILYSFESYASVIRPFGLYYRYMDQTDPDIQQQMIDYLEDLETLPEISSSIPVDFSGQEDFVLGANVTEIQPFCWVRDFRTFGPIIAQQYPQFVNWPFTTQLAAAMQDPVIREVYGSDIVRDEDGNITASRCWIFLSGLDLNSVDAQLQVLHDQREVGARQPLNKANPDNWRMFLFDSIMLYWEAYDSALRELWFTIITGILSLAVISFLLIPHWTATFFVTPFMCMLYCNYLGTLELLGLHINGILYICVVVAVGLLVDFLMHMLLRYYETSVRKTRDERVKETLETMGASILLGGFTTFLGVIPLCFTTTAIFRLVFWAFFGMITLGVLTGLILLPVVLSLIGPTTGLEEHQSAVAAQREKRDSRVVTVGRMSLMELAETDESVMMALREYEEMEESDREMSGPLVIPKRRNTITDVEC